MSSASTRGRGCPQQRQERSLEGGCQAGRASGTQHTRRGPTEVALHSHHSRSHRAVPAWPGSAHGPAPREGPRPEGVWDCGLRRAVTAPCTFHERAGQCPAEARHRTSFPLGFTGCFQHPGPAPPGLLASAPQAATCRSPQCTCPSGSLAVSCGPPCSGPVRWPSEAVPSCSPPSVSPGTSTSCPPSGRGWQGLRGKGAGRRRQACRDARAGACEEPGVRGAGRGQGCALLLAAAPWRPLSAPSALGGSGL